MHTPTLFLYIIWLTGEFPERTGKVCSANRTSCSYDLSCQATTMERIMKNLRLEITQLRRSLDESRYLFTFSEREGRGRGGSIKQNTTE